MSVNSNSITTGGRSYFAGVREVIREKLQYPRQVLVSIRARATDQLSGSMRFSCVGDMAIVQVWDGFTHEGERPVRTDGLSTTVTTDCDAFDSLRPGDEIIANGLHRRVVEKVSANRVVVHQAVDWSGGAGCSFRWRHFSLDWSDNPAWVAYDIFTQPVIAGEGITASPFAIVRFDGIDPSRMDLPRFKEWADYCDDPVPDGSGGTEKRITFNGGFDFDTSLWEAGLRVCQVGRAVPVWNGVHLTLAIDKPSDPVNLYTVGNIEESRFKEIFLPMEERATQIEIDYVNRENDFQRDKLTVCRTDSANPYRANIDLFGITKPSQAWRAGMYRLNCNKYLVRSAEIDVDIEALNAQIGDVVSIQHDVPRWGAGGRLLGADADTVVLDREVTIEEGLAYKLLVRLAEDVVHEREVLNAAGAHSVLIVSPAFDTSADFDPATEYHQDDTVRYEGRIYRCVRQTPVPSPPPADTSYWYSTDSCPLPEKHDLYAFGQMDKHARRFRITDITRSQDQKITLCMIEYRPEVYESENCDPGLNDYTQTLLKRMEPQNVKLTEGICFGPAGIPIYSISIAFTQSSDATYKHAEIWYALVNGTDQLGWNWLYVGASAGTSFEIRGVDLSRTYAVILIPVDVSGRKLHHAHAAVHQISISIGAGRSGSQVRYPDSPGGANLLTSGLSVTVTTTEDAFEFVQVSDRIIADSEVRTVIEKLSSNEVLVDEPVDWSNEGAGYPFTYDAPLTALRPAEQGATEGAVIGENLRGSDGRTIITDSRIYGPDLPAIDPGTAGLYTVQDYLGYWDGSEWKVFISRAGSFLFKGDNDNFIQWNGSALSVRGSINAQDISAGTIHADRISAGTITTSKIEDGACTAKAQETASSYTGAASGQFNEALSVVLTVTVGAWILLHAECQSSARTQLIRTSNLNGQIQNAILIDKASGGFNTTTLDTPGGGSGTVTYRIYVHGQNSVTSLQISAIELRR
ncbi:MAG: phage tail protein [Syntrophobacteraceae bacterium]